MDLKSIPTDAPSDLTKKDIKKKTDKLTREIADYQHLLYAENKKALLIVLQGMDATGKDGATRKVFRYCSPAGVTAHAFKKPTEVEFEHDFLWRVHKLVPAKGQVVIFNRSHYEDILIQRVHNWVDEERVNLRIQAINNFEQTLIHDNNTTILKFYMHISPEKQKQKLQERIDNPRKNWKHNDNDWKERKYWDLYLKAYEDAMERCNTPPWHVIPVDRRWYRDYCIAQIILESLKSMSFELPVLGPDKQISY